MNNDFKQTTVGAPLKLRIGDDAWGPFSFGVSKKLPDGVTVASVEISSYLNGETPDKEIVKSGSPAVVDDTTVKAKFQAPSGAETGNYWVDIKLTLSDSSIKHLAWGPVEVVGWS